VQVLHYVSLLDTYQRQAGSNTFNVAVYASDSDIFIGLASLGGQLTGSTMGIVYRPGWCKDSQCYVEHDAR
jgi:hypothetical protein